MQRRGFVGLLGLAGASVVGLTACGKRVFYAPQAEFDDNVQIRIRQAYVRGDRFWIKSYVVNGGPTPIQVNRDAWQLRLPGGMTVPRRRSMGQAVYLIPPGQGRNVDVDFEASDETWERIGEAALIIGGVTVGEQPEKTIGEIPLSRHPAPIMGPPAPATGAPAPNDTAVPAPTDTAAPAPTDAAAPPSVVPTTTSTPPPVTPAPSPVPSVVP